MFNKWEAVQQMALLVICLSKVPFRALQKGLPEVVTSRRHFLAGESLEPRLETTVSRGHGVKKGLTGIEDKVKKS